MPEENAELVRRIYDRRNRHTASGRGSGVPLEGEHGYVWTVRYGQAVRFRWFQSHREALDAGGLSELS